MAQSFVPLTPTGWCGEVNIASELASSHPSHLAAWTGRVGRKRTIVRRDVSAPRARLGWSEVEVERASGASRPAVASSEPRPDRRAPDLNRRRAEEMDGSPSTTMAPTRACATLHPREAWRTSGAVASPPIPPAFWLCRNHPMTTPPPPTCAPPLLFPDVAMYGVANRQLPLWWLLARPASLLHRARCPALLPCPRSCTSLHASFLLVHYPAFFSPTLCAHSIAFRIDLLPAAPSAHLSL